MKKIVLKTILGILLLCLLSMVGFKQYEKMVGKSFLPYLQENMATFDLDKAYDFQSMKEDIANHHLILVGEVHGFEEPTFFDVQFLDYLFTEHEVTHYFVEMDLSQAYYLNRFNETGDVKVLDEVLSHWVVTAGRNNLDYRNKWIALRKLYQQGKKFTYLGNNNLQDVALLFRHLNEIEPNLPLDYDPEASDSVNLVRVKEELNAKIAGAEENAPFVLKYLLSNVEHYLQNDYREIVLTANFMSLFEHYQLRDEKVYGYYGLGHTLLAPIAGGYKAMAYRLKEEDPWFENEILSINFVFQDSHRVVGSKGLPFFMKEEGPYTRLNVSYDNIFLSYLHGTAELAAASSPYTKSIVRLDAPNSPYRTTNRLAKMSKLLPMGSLINAEEGYVTTDYYQYLLFIRNSDWAEPMPVSSSSTNSSGVGSTE